MAPWLTITVIIAGVLIAAYLVISSRTDTFTGRWMAWKSSDVDDHLRFPSHPIQKAPPTFFFERSDQPLLIESISYSYKDRPQSENLEALLEKSGTSAFLVIKGDQILFENYFNGYQRDSLITSFSVAKSITSLMVGAAIDDGYIHSLNDPVTRYLPELLQVDPDYQNVTLAHLLSMKSGIAFKDTDIPWHDKSRAYYHPFLRRVVTNLPLSEPPGQTWMYNTFNPILLGLVLEKATGRSVAEYFEARIWQRMGMEFDASWSIDSKADGMAKMESGLNARAIDFAKIGRLVLRRGDWNGDQVVSRAWMEASMMIDPASNVAKFGAHTFYQYGWWIHAPTTVDKYTVFGWGHLGQYLFVFPDDDMIVLRFGREIGKVDSWRRIAQEIIGLFQAGDESRPPSNVPLAAFSGDMLNPR